MTFHSILFDRTEDGPENETIQAPAFFTDLNLDQIVDAITTTKQEYNLRPLFYRPLRDVDAIRYRQEVMRDLENKALYEHVESFAQRMRVMRQHLVQASKLYYKHQKESWFLDAVEVYCDAIERLVHDFYLVELRSRGFLAFRDYLRAYAESARFTTLLAETRKLKADLSTVTYSLVIRDSSINVRKYESEADYSADVEATFEKFKQGAVKDYAVKFLSSLDMNQVEAQILDFVARLYPDIFSSLDRFCANNGNYLDEAIGVFDREIQFYVGYLQYIAPLRQAGLEFCYPEVSNGAKEVYNCEGFDLALAHKLVGEHAPVVRNDFYLQGSERVFVVSGPNQGGKTTFARTFGQLHYLASIGCVVPGRKARLFLFDQLFTHFEREENIKNLRGKLEDDLVRIHDILRQATPNSIIILNEIFTSTTLKDAVFLSKRVMQEVLQLDALCVWVTFIDELASLSEKTVSMVSTVVPENPAVRTYKVVRRPADGLSYAIAIAEKYRVTYERLKERLKS
ncbi:MAG: MutS-related protein [Chloroflexota bacterium]